MFSYLVAPLLAAILLVSMRSVMAEPLGRLFFTPGERAAMERQRQPASIHDVEVSGDAVISLDGVVVRSSGRRTTWVNGQARYDVVVPAGITLSDGDPGRAILSFGEETAAPIKVGESINRVTRKTTNGLREGQISIGGSRTGIGR